MANNILSDFLNEIDSRGERYQAADPPTGAPPKDHERRRDRIWMGSGQTDDRPVLTIEQARAHIRQRMTDYLATPDPDHILLVALPPGSGKTYEAVRQAEHWARQHIEGRVLYAGPRHNLWDDLMATAAFPAMWYHWQPHTGGDVETGQGQTCRFAPQFRSWVERGYPGIEFCKKKSVCAGYMKQCVYLSQKEKRQPIVFVQHADIALGHPFLEHTSLLIGDESPLDAFLHPWLIPARDIVPPNLWNDPSPNVELIDLLRTFRDLVDQPATPEPKRALGWEGPALLEKAGGAAHVLAVCKSAGIDRASRAYVPHLWGPDQADSLPYWHLEYLIPILAEEAQEALVGREYVRRVRITKEGLLILLRRDRLNLPPHVIWLDATANPDLYQAIFRTERKIEVVDPHVQLSGHVYQVWPSLNNKDTIVGADQPKNGKRPAKKRQAKRDAIDQQVGHIVRTRGYVQPAIVTYKDLTKGFSEFETAHFGGLRGTNRLQHCDALIVIGTPQASIPTLVDQAAMLLNTRLLPFDTTWNDQEQRYVGHPYGYPVSGFWHDPTLHALLVQTREAELVQAAHRVRPLYRPVDVWLLTNLPLTAMPPDELLDIRDLFGAPNQVDPYRWQALLQMVDDAGDDGVSAADIRTALDIPARTADRWFAALCAAPGMLIRERSSKTGGRPARICVKSSSAEFPPLVNIYI